MTPAPQPNAVLFQHKDNRDSKGRILNVLVKMKNDGADDSHIENTDDRLRHLNKYSNLEQPEVVKQFIARKPNVTNGYRRALVQAYDKYCQYYKIQWTKPNYQQDSKAIRIPTSEQLEMLIAHARRVMSTKLRMSKETGLRPVELCNLKVKDVDLEQRLVYPTTAKHGAARRLKISTTLKALVVSHIDKNGLQPSDELFEGDSEYYGKYYRQMRNNLAEKLCKPELRAIRLYDFRHYFATMLYAKTRDILLVKQQMGHKKIETTLIYTQLLNLHDDEWTCRYAENKDQAQPLIEAGFEYVATTPEGLMLFRKRKINT